MPEWNDVDPIRLVQQFVRVFELGSLSAAARELKTTQPTISKGLAALEQRLGVRLFERATTGLAPTDAGRRYYERARPLLDAWDEAAAAARDDPDTPRGRVRFGAPLALGELKLNAVLLPFLAQHPRVEIDLRLDDRYVDPVEAGLDLLLRLGSPLPAQAVARPLALLPRGLAAAPAYLARHTPIRTPADLAQHEQVRFAGSAFGDTLTLQGAGGAVDVAPRCRYRVNSAIALRDALRRGAGIGLVPHWLVHDALADGTLQHVLPDWSIVPQQATLLFPSRRFRPLAVRRLAEALQDALLRLPGFLPAEHGVDPPATGGGR